MALRSKIAAALAALLLALPVASAATCLLHRPQTAGKIAHCQMLAHRGMAARQDAQLKNECCSLSSGQSLPPLRPEVQQGKLDAADIAASVTATAYSPTIQSKAAATAFPVLRPGPNHQALLCIFLI